jgi:acyl transferase domain-containing protein
VSRNSALKLAYFRGIVSEELSLRDTTGGMMVAGMSSSQAKTLLMTSKDTDGLSIACINSPKSVTISGDRQALEVLQSALNSENIFNRMLLVDVAYHSPQMRSTAAAYAQKVGLLETGPPQKKPPILISSVTGEYVDPDHLCQADYWVQNMLQPVRFSDAIRRLCCSTTSDRRKRLDGSHRKHVLISCLVEVGPHSALQGPIKDIFQVNPPGSKISYHTSLRRGWDAISSFLTTLGQLKCLGVSLDVDLVNLLSQEPKSRVQKRVILADLPEYPFDHTHTYWPLGRLGKEFRFRRSMKHDFLGKPVVDWNPFEPRWRNFLRLSELPWAADHQVRKSGPGAYNSLS